MSSLLGLKILFTLTSLVGLLDIANKLYLKSLVNTLVDGVIIAKPLKKNKTLLGLRVELMNRVASSILEREDLLGKELFKEYPDQNKGLVKSYQDVSNKKGRFSSLVVLNGKTIEFSASRIFRGLILISFKDVTPIIEKARLDPLTGLPNRSGLPLIGSNYHSLLMLDINRFREINNSKGYQTGDIVLKYVATRLKELDSQFHLSSSYRISSNEFLVVFYEEPTDTLLNMIIEELTGPFRVVISNKLGDSVLVSITISKFTNNSSSIEEGLSKLDAALYRAKESRLAYYSYSSQMDLERELELLKEERIREAIYNNELVLHYQPIVDLSTRESLGNEVLVRWAHPTEGLIYPSAFLPLATKSGLITDITSKVLDCLICESNKPEGFLSINISALDLNNPVLSSKLEVLFETHDLLLELVEDLHLEVPKLDILLTSIKSSGSLLALDDFGSGYNSMVRLVSLPIDVVKIDKTFVRGESSSLDICKAIVHIAKSKSLLVIAEGIETEREAISMREIGCDMGQGYYFGRPRAI